MLHQLNEAITLWREAGDEFVLVRATRTLGLGSRHLDEVMLVNGRGEIAGRIAGPTAATRVRDHIGATILGHEPAGAIERTVDVSASEARHDGLTCGGTVDLLIQRIDHAPELLWTALAARQPVALISATGPQPSPPEWLVVTSDELQGSLGHHLDEMAACGDARYQLAMGTPDRRVFATVAGELILDVFAPPPRLCVIGAGDLAETLERQGELLGWEVSVSSNLEHSLAAVTGLGPSDAIVVLSHDPAIDTPVIASAIGQHVGYIGALGARTTQVARRRRLAEHGVADHHIDTIRGPVGLDLGARSPAETSVAIFAEILSTRSRRTAVSLRDHDGPIHVRP